MPASHAVAEGQMFRSLADHSQEFIGICDLNFKPLYVNQAGLRLLGLPSLEQACAARVQDYFFPEDHQFVTEEVFPKVLREGQAETEIRFRHFMTGAAVWMIGNVFQVRDAQGRVSGYATVSRDITERKRAEVALRESRDRFQRVLEVETVGVMFWDLSTGQMTDANDAFLRMMGYSRSQVEAGELTWQKLTPPEYIEVSKAEIRKFMATGRVGPYEKEYFRKDGTRQWLVFAGSSLGQNTCVEFCVDISARKQAEAALRHSEERFRVVQELSPDGFILFHPERDAEGRIVDFTWLYENAAMARMNGSKPGDVVGKRLLETYPRNAGTPFFKAYREVAETGKATVLEDSYQGETVTTPKWFRATVVRTGEDIAVLVQDFTERNQVEGKLRKSEERFDLAVRSAGVGIWDYDIDLDRVYFSPFWKSLFGYQEQEIGPRVEDWARLLHPDEKEGILKLQEDFLAGTGSMLTAEYRLRHKDGSYRWIHAQGLVVRDETGRARRFVGSHADITERKEAERALAEQARLLDLSFDAIIVRDREDRVKYWNRGAQELYGYTQEEARGHVIHELLRTEFSEPLKSVRERLNRDGKWNGELVHRRKDGSRVVVLSRWSADRDLDGRVAGVLETNNDITRRKRTEQELAERDERFSTLLQNLETGVALVDEGGRFVLYNHAFLRIFGLSSDVGNLMDQDWSRWEVFGEDGRLLPLSEHPVRKAALTGKAVRNQMVQMKRPSDGVVLWMLLSAEPILKADGALGVMICTYYDITERKQAEDEVRARERDLREAQRLAGLGSWEWDTRSNQVKWSSELRRLLLVDEDWPVPGYAEQGRFYTADSRKRLDEAVERAFRRGTPYELDIEMIRTDESTIWVTARGEPVRGGSGEIIGLRGTVMNITDRKRAEEQVRRRAEELQGLLETVPAAVWISHDRECKTIEGNAEANRIYEAVGTENVSATTRPEPRRFFTPEGRELAASELPMQAAAAGNREVRDTELQVQLPSGKRIAIVGSAVPLRDEKDEVRGCVAAFLDITARKEAERVLARDKHELQQLVEERTAKLRELVGELEHFSYTITHDLKSPLRAMRGFAEMAALACAEGKPCESKEFLRRISTAAERMDRLIADALNYGRAVRQELPLEDVDSGPLLRGMLDCYPELQPSMARIRVQGRLPMVLANEAGLTQVFSNLLGNAVKFVKPGAKPEVRIWAEKVAHSRHPGWVRIWVEDKGIGIARDMLPRVFDMFARGSKDYEGTGIGLALVRKVVQQMGGKVGVESEQGKGSRFWVELKLANTHSNSGSWTSDHSNR